jgi:tetratricopeptide (TPR) repeat protein
VLKRALAVLLVVACAGGVVAYQVSRPAQAPASATLFVPSPKFFLDLSPGFRTSIADAYYLKLVQYYGEYAAGQHGLDAAPAMIDLITSLSPHFKRPYVFGAFALTDAGRPDQAVELLKRGFRNNPRQYVYPSFIGYFTYQYGAGKDKDVRAAEWYQKAAAIPGSPAYLGRLAAVLLAKGGATEKAVTMWGQVWLGGDKYSRGKAVAGLDQLLPKDPAARLRALAPLSETMPKADYDALVGLLVPGAGQ